MQKLETLLLTSGRRNETILFDNALKHVEVVNSAIFKRNGDAIDWQEKQNDFIILHQIDELIRETIYLCPEDLLLIKDEIRKKLLQTHLFQSLINSDLKLSNAHQHETLLDHSLNVYTHSISSDYLNEYGRNALRAQLWSALLHDIGKIFGASGAESQHHAILSAILIKEFVYQLEDMPWELATGIIEATAYHHSFEEIERKLKTASDLYNRFLSATSRKIFWELSKADILSTPQYIKYLGKNQLIFELTFEVLYLQQRAGIDVKRQRAII